MICFTERGAWVCRRLFHKLKETGEECEAIIPKRFLREEWKKEGLKEREEGVFIPMDRQDVCRKACNDLCKRHRYCSAGYCAMDQG